MTSAVTHDVDRIRARAYRLWQTEGCRDGCCLDYWLRAESELAAEADPSALAPPPAAPMEEPAPPARSKRRANPIPPA